MRQTRLGPWKQCARLVLTTESAGAHRPVLQDDESRVENLRIDEFEGGPRIASTYWLPTNNAQDHRKDYEPESINKSELHQAVDETNTAN